MPLFFTCVAPKGPPWYHMIDLRPQFALNWFPTRREFINHKYLFLRRNVTTIVRTTKKEKRYSKYIKQTRFYVWCHHEIECTKFQDRLCSFGGKRKLPVKGPQKVPFSWNLEKERFSGGEPPKITGFFISLLVVFSKMGIIDGVLSKSSEGAAIHLLWAFGIGVCSDIYGTDPRTKVRHLLMIFLDFWSHPASIPRAHKNWSHAPEKVCPATEIFLTGRGNPEIFSTYLILVSPDPLKILSQWWDTSVQTLTIFFPF